eukprot:GEMP01056962.1.p1 GENE.GEMP01056962.1~~GEMP01056962.1.p1  ORF type:complete len:197 (+),score=52.45 GEMP01056962.1:390-980(+)
MRRAVRLHSPPPLPEAIRARMAAGENCKSSGSAMASGVHKFRNPLRTFAPGKSGTFRGKGNVMFAFCMVPGVVLLTNYLVQTLTTKDDAPSSRVCENQPRGIDAKTFRITLRREQRAWMRENDLGHLVDFARRAGPEVWKEIFEVTRCSGTAEEEKVEVSLRDEDWKFMCERASHARLTEEKALRVLITYAMQERE